ncbi:MAG: HDOD domain-containing protein [Pseudomonadales bacterium]|nr:HDOD domain-containing protein [Pseudomonadales bacterium]
MRTSSAEGAAPILVPYPAPPTEERVHAQIMGDAGGEVQVLSPGDALVDIEQLHALAKRRLQPRSWVTAEPISAIPGQPGLPVFIDETLLAAPRLALATGLPDDYVAIRGEELPGCTGNVRIGAFCAAIAAAPTPSDRSADRELIENTISRFTERRIRQRLDETLQIPPLPMNVRQIMELQADPDCELRDVVVVVESDPSLAARIVGWANSAFYSPRSPARGVGDAINRVLGIRTALNMALGISLSGSLRMPATQVAGAPPFWLEALLTASTLEALASASRLPGAPAPGDAYLVGLLANFGTLVIGHVFPQHYERICRLQEANRHLTHAHVDQHVLQLPREVIAAALLESWDLPLSVTEPIRFQLVPDYAGTSDMQLQFLRLARDLLAAEGLIEPPDRTLPVADPEALGVSDRGLATVMQRLQSSRDMLDGAESALPG